MMGFGLIEILISAQKIFAVSFDIEGLVSSINYSYKVMNLPISIFLFSVLSVLFPTMTKIKDQKELDKIAINLLSAIFFVMLPFTVILFNYAEFIISILFERGEFGKQSVSITASQLKSFSLLLIPLSFFAAQLRIVFVQRKWSKIYYSGLMIITFSIVLNLIAIQYSSLILFSYSLPIAYISSIVIVFKKSLLLSINPDLIKTVIAVLTSIIVTMLINTFLQINQLIIIEICIMIGVYFIMQYLIKNTLLMKILRR
ncbi:hypothetical protein SporoP8_12205 [Sporosarcina ureae]|nr:hypothetical protein SporoP8_12205 [Sporosarcina ureae]